MSITENDIICQDPLDSLAVSMQALNYCGREIKYDRFSGRQSA